MLNNFFHLLCVKRKVEDFMVMLIIEGKLILSRPGFFCSVFWGTGGGGGRGRRTVGAPPKSYSGSKPPRALASNEKKKKNKK